MRLWCFLVCITALLACKKDINPPKALTDWELAERNFLIDGYQLNLICPLGRTDADGKISASNVYMGILRASQKNNEWGLIYYKLNEDNETIKTEVAAIVEPLVMDERFIEGISVNGIPPRMVRVKYFSKLSDDQEKNITDPGVKILNLENEPRLIATLNTALMYGQISVSDEKEPNLHAVGECRAP